VVRRRDWEERLHAFANAKSGKAFRWGSTDCGSLVRGAMHATHTGKPLGTIEPYRGRDAAERTLEAMGGTTLRLEASGATQVALPFTQPGDVLVLPGHDGNGLPRMGVVLNRGRVLTSLPGHGVYVGPVVVDGAEVWRLPA